MSLHFTALRLKWPWTTLWLGESLALWKALSLAMQYEGFQAPISYYRRAFIMDSSPFHGQTASPCILNRAPYGPICTAQFTGVTSDLLEEKLRPFPWSPYWGGGREAGPREGVRMRGWAWLTHWARTTSAIHTFTHTFRRECGTQDIVPLLIHIYAHNTFQMYSTAHNQTANHQRDELG